jgi:nicotinate-nucleotide adenylyltransferase
MTQTLPPIGLLGGTFDPIHNGHLRVAIEIKQALGLQSIRLIPCHRPPHREQPQASAEHRINMITRAIEHCPDLILDTREIQRDTPSYTVDTLRELRQELGNTQPLCLIMGKEVFNDLPTWHEPHALLQLAHIIVADRPTAITPSSQLTPFLAHQTDQHFEITHKPCGHVYFQHITKLEISASQIRQLLKTQQSPQFLLPDSVLAYIMQHHLYTQ